MPDRAIINRIAVLAGWAVFLVVCAIWAADLHASHSPSHFMNRDAAKLEGWELPFVALGFECDDALAPAELHQMRELHRALEATPGVADVQSLPGFLGALEQMPVPMRAALASRPSLAGNLITPSRDRAAMWVSLQSGRALPAVRSVIEEHPEAGVVQIAGSAVFTELFDEMLRRDLLVVAPVLLLLVGVGIGLVFRSLRAVIGCLAVVTAGLLASTLPLSLFGLPLTILSLTALPVISVAGLGVAVHWLWAWHRLGDHEAVAHEIRSPSTWATVTTAAAMASLALSGFPALRSLGVSAAAGVLVTLPLTFALFPALFRFSPAPSPQAPWPGAPFPRLPPTARRALWGTSVILLAAVAAGLPRLTVESNIALALPDRTELRRAERWFENGFGGLIPLTIAVQGDGAGHAGAADATLAFLRDHVSAGVVPVPGEGDLFRASVRLPELPSRRLASLQTSIQSDVAALWPADHRITLSGAVPGLLSSMDQMLRSLAVSLLVALGIVTLMMVMALRSVRWGLASMVPNALPILCTLGLMGWVRKPIDLATTSIGCAALGVAVDDTIHMLHRHRWGRRRGEALAAAHRRFLTEVGPALVLTTVLSTVGFAILSLSTFEPLRWFGLWVAVALGLALLLDLALLPSLLRAITPKENTAC